MKKANLILLEVILVGMLSRGFSAQFIQSGVCFLQWVLPHFMFCLVSFECSLREKIKNTVSAGLVIALHTPNSAAAFAFNAWCILKRQCWLDWIQAHQWLLRWRSPKVDHSPEIYSVILEWPYHIFLHILYLMTVFRTKKKKKRSNLTFIQSCLGRLTVALEPIPGTLDTIQTFSHIENWM